MQNNFLTTIRNLKLICDRYLGQRSLFQALLDPKLLRRGLRSATAHDPDVHRKVVLSAWQRYERREDELVHHGCSSAGKSPLNPCTATSPSLECLKAALQAGYFPDLPFDPCPCQMPAGSGLKTKEIGGEEEEEEEDLWFCIGDDEVGCVRHKMRLEACGHASFAPYYFLSQVAMEEDMRSNTTVMLLERLEECAAPVLQKLLALH